MTDDPLNTGERDTVQVVADLCRTAEGLSKTRLFVKANLNHQRGNKYLRSLLRRGLIEHRDDGYHRTQKGLRLVREFHTVEKLLGDGYRGDAL